MLILSWRSGRQISGVLAVLVLLMGGATAVQAWSGAAFLPSGDLLQHSRRMLRRAGVCSAAPRGRVAAARARGANDPRMEADAEGWITTPGQALRPATPAVGRGKKAAAQRAESLLQEAVRTQELGGKASTAPVTRAGSADQAGGGWAMLSQVLASGVQLSDEELKAGVRSQSRGQVDRTPRATASRGPNISKNNAADGGEARQIKSAATKTTRATVPKKSSRPAPPDSVVRAASAAPTERARVGTGHDGTADGEGPNEGKVAVIDPRDAWTSDKPMPRLKRPEELLELLRICKLPLKGIDGYPDLPVESEEISIQQVRLTGRRWFVWLEANDLIQHGKDPGRFPRDIREKYLAHAIGAGEQLVDEEQAAATMLEYLRTRERRDIQRSLKYVEKLAGDYALLFGAPALESVVQQVLLVLHVRSGVGVSVCRCMLTASLLPPRPYPLSCTSSHAQTHTHTHAHIPDVHCVDQVHASARRSSGG